MLSVGIVGLPNVGKSTLFNALTAGHANVSNYPFTTIDSNLGVVPVPDPRLLELEQLLDPEECTPCTIEFIDIAGLVEGASRGEGLGNQFLGSIRQVDAIAHVLRFFEEGDVAHVFETVDAVRDAQVVETELLLSDLEVLKRALEKRQRHWKADPKAHAAEKERLEHYLAKLEEGVPLRSPGDRDLRVGPIGRGLFRAARVDSLLHPGQPQAAGLGDRGGYGGAGSGGQDPHRHGDRLYTGSGGLVRTDAGTRWIPGAPPQGTAAD
jgi:small GTP-binding protein